MFHVCRKTQPYTGKPHEMAGIPWSFDSREKAIKAAQALATQAGEWVVYDSETGEIVYAK